MENKPSAPLTPAPKTPPTDIMPPVIDPVDKTPPTDIMPPVIDPVDKTPPGDTMPPDRIEDGPSAPPTPYPFNNAERVPANWHITEEGEDIMAINTVTNRSLITTRQDFSAMLRS